MCAACQSESQHVKRELHCRNGATQRIQMSLRKRSKGCLTAVRRILEVSLGLIKCVVKIMNRDAMAEGKPLTYFQGSLYWKCCFKISLQFFTGEKFSEMNEQQSITISF